jgi:hypothetical protein
MIDQSRPELDTAKTKVNYDRLGKAVEEALILDYIYVLHSTGRQIWSSFIRGVFAGIGGVLGATLGVAVLVGLLQLFGGAPVIGHFFRDISHTIQER